MKNTSSFKQKLIQFFIIICIFIVAVSATFLLIRAQFTSIGLAIIFGVILFFCLLFIHRQFRITREIAFLKNHIVEAPESATNTAALLTGLNAKIEQEAKSSFQLGQNHGVFSTRLTELEERIQLLESGQAKMATGSPAALPHIHAAQFAETSLEDEIQDKQPPKTEKKNKPKKATLEAALKSDKLSMHLQPIVQLPSRSPKFFDAFMRLQTGDKEYLDNSEFSKLAEEGGLIPTIDTKIIFSSIRMIKTLTSLKKQTGMFCKISKKTLSGTTAFANIIQYLEANKDLSQSLVFSLTHRDFLALRAKEKSKLKKITDLGFQLALDEVADLKLDSAKLASQNVRYIKIPVSILLHANIDSETEEGQPTGLAASLRENEIELISTEIDQESQVLNLSDYGVGFGQGVLFAPPRAVKDELLESKKTK